MLEVGRILGTDGKMDYGWNRAHFGAWCVVSAPLILGMDVTKQEIVGPVIDIITNPEAIAVNQVSSAPEVSCLGFVATQKKTKWVSLLTTG